jgi:hypothetical protein
VGIVQQSALSIQLDLFISCHPERRKPLACEWLSSRRTSRSYTPAPNLQGILLLSFGRNAFSRSCLYMRASGSFRLRKNLASRSPSAAHDDSSFTNTTSPHLREAPSFTMTDVFPFPTSPAFPTSTHPGTRGCGALPLASARRGTSASPAPQMLKSNLAL